MTTIRRQVKSWQGDGKPNIAACRYDDPGYWPPPSGSEQPFLLMSAAVIETILLLCMNEQLATALVATGPEAARRTESWNGPWAGGLFLIASTFAVLAVIPEWWVRVATCSLLLVCLMQIQKRAPLRFALRAGLIAWGLILLLPWGYYSLLRGWSYLGAEVDPALTASLPIHLVALGGIWFAGILPLRLTKSKLENERRVVAKWSSLAIVTLLACALTLLAATTFSADGGAVQLDGQYGQATRQNSGLLATQFIPMAVGLALLVGSAVRTTSRKRPSWSEVAAVGTVVLTELASGVRIRAFVIAFGWLGIQWVSRDRPKRSAASTAMIAYAASFFVLGAFVSMIFVANVLVAVRSGVGYENYQSGYLDFNATSLDVVGSADIWLNASPEKLDGLGDGFDILRTPLRLIPSGLGGLDGADPVVVQSQEVLVNGASAPFWFALLFDWGLIGVFAGMAAVVGGFEVGFSMVARLIGNSVVLRRLAPVLSLVMFMMLSRLAPIQFLVTLLFVAAGLGLAKATLRTERLRPVKPSQVSSAATLSRS